MPKTILIIEDNDENRQLFSLILNHHGYNVVEAINGEKGLSLAREYIPDLILMDIQMPVMDGTATMQSIKADPLLQKIKIIAVTSFAMKGDQDKYLENGFDGYITKPVDTRQLPEQIRSFL
jgi:two-component system, cell cycle response regulator DivK